MHDSLLGLCCKHTCVICGDSLFSAWGSASSSSCSSPGITTTGFLYSPRAAARRKFGGD